MSLGSLHVPPQSGASGASSIYLTALDLNGLEGSVASGTISSRIFHRTLADAATTGVSGHVYAPGWATMHVDLLWAENGALGTAFRVDCSVDHVAPGEAPSDAFSATASTITPAGGSTVLTVSRLLADAAVSEYLNIVRVRRLGTDGADVNTNGLLVYGLLLTQAS
jgi:hypothetical protein